MKPIGLEHQERGFAVIKISHEIISAHQKEFPELAKKMKHNPDATKVYGSFICLLPFKVKQKLTSKIREKILRWFGQ